MRYLSLADRIYSLQAEVDYNEISTGSKFEVISVNLMVHSKAPVMVLSDLICSYLMTS